MGKLNKILIVNEIHQFAINELNALDFELVYLPDISNYEIKSKIEDCVGLIVRSKNINKEIIDFSKQLKFIARIGSGMENIDVNYATQKGIKCINSPEGNRDSVGEYVVSVILNLLHNIKMSDKELGHGLWKRKENFGYELNSKIVGIIGYGNMGSAVAEKLKSFGTCVIGYDKYKKNYSSNFITEVALENLFSEADILSLHIPLSKETISMADDKFFKKFKKNIYFINTSRGQVVNTKDLVKNLKSGKIIGAALDVLEYESHDYGKLDNIDQETFDYLRQADNVIITPHIAGQSRESSFKHAKIIVDKIKLINLISK